jgi:hypothetical protein
MKLQSWPVGIFIFYVLFVAVLIFRMLLVQENGIDLVTPDYYQQGVAYQDRIDAIQRSESLAKQIEIKLDTESKQLHFHVPKSFKSPFQGTLNFFRPSDSGLDFALPMQIDPDGNQVVDISKYQPGLWKIKIEWEMAGLKYYQEKAVTFP